MSDAAKKRKRGPLSEETKAKISAANAGKKRTPEMIDNIRNAQLKRYAEKGAPKKSEETKRKMSEAAYRREARKRVEKEATQND